MQSSTPRGEKNKMHVTWLSSHISTTTESEGSVSSCRSKAEYKPTVPAIVLRSGLSHTSWGFIEHLGLACIFNMEKRFTEQGAQDSKLAVVLYLCIQIDCTTGDATSSFAPTFSWKSISRTEDCAATQQRNSSMGSGGAW